MTPYRAAALSERRTTEKRVADGSMCIEHANRPADVWHHVVPFVLGGTATVPLCDECHSKVHGFSINSTLEHRALVKEGLRRSKESGTKLGRPSKCDKWLIRRLLAEGNSYRQIREKTKASNWLISDVKKDLDDPVIAEQLRVYIETNKKPDPLDTGETIILDLLDYDPLK